MFMSSIPSKVFNALACLIVMSGCVVLDNCIIKTIIAMSFIYRPFLPVSAENFVRVLCLCRSWDVTALRGKNLLTDV